MIQVSEEIKSKVTIPSSSTHHVILPSQKGFVAWAYGRTKIGFGTIEKAHEWCVEVLTNEVNSYRDIPVTIPEFRRIEDQLRWLSNHLIVNG